MPTALCQVVSFIGAASLAAAQATLDAGVAAAVGAGFIPECFSPLPAIPTSGGTGRVNGLSLEGRSTPLWTGVTAAECVLLKVNGRADSVAIEAAIALEISAQSAGVTPTLRHVEFFSLSLNDGRVDAMALLFTDGVPNGISVADQAKLDGMQPQGATATPVGTPIPVDWDAAGTFRLVLGAGANAVAFSNVASGKLVVVEAESDAGGSTIVWPFSITWAGGVVPVQTSPSGIDVYTFVCIAGAVRGSALQAFA